MLLIETAHDCHRENMCHCSCVCATSVRAAEEMLSLKATPSRIWPTEFITLELMVGWQLTVFCTKPNTTNRTDRERAILLYNSLHIHLLLLSANGWFSVLWRRCYSNRTSTYYSPYERMARSWSVVSERVYQLVIAFWFGYLVFLPLHYQCYWLNPRKRYPFCKKTTNSLF